VGRVVPAVPVLRAEVVVGWGDIVVGMGSLTNEASNTRDDEVVAVAGFVAVGVSEKMSVS